MPINVDNDVFIIERRKTIFVLSKYESSKLDKVV